MERIYYRDIFYIEKEGKYVNIVHRFGETRERKTLRMMLEELDGAEFCYLDKSRLVNLTNMAACRREGVLLFGNITLTVSRTRYGEVLEKLREYWKGRGKG